MRHFRICLDSPIPKTKRTAFFDKRHINPELVLVVFVFVAVDVGLQLQTHRTVIW